jgi:hypothetical protein
LWALPQEVASISFILLGYAQLLDKIHIFDWNIFNNGIMAGRAIDPRLRGEGFMLDFDGILCPDPDRWHTDTDEATVQKWLRDVIPERVQVVKRFLPEFSSSFSHQRMYALRQSS